MERAPDYALRPRAPKPPGVDGTCSRRHRLHAWLSFLSGVLKARGRLLAREIGFPQVSVSHEILPLIKLIGRGDTTVVDAYLADLRNNVERIAKS